MLLDKHETHNKSTHTNTQTNTQTNNSILKPPKVKSASRNYSDILFVFLPQISKLLPLGFIVSLSGVKYA